MEDYRHRVPCLDERNYVKYRLNLYFMSLDECQNDALPSKAINV